MPRYKTCISARILLFCERENTTGLSDLLCKRLKIPSIAILPSYPVVFWTPPILFFYFDIGFSIFRVPPFKNSPGTSCRKPHAVYLAIIRFFYLYMYAHREKVTIRFCFLYYFTGGKRTCIYSLNGINSQAIRTDGMADKSYKQTGRLSIFLLSSTINMVSHYSPIFQRQFYIFTISRQDLRQQFIAQ